MNAKRLLPALFVALLLAIVAYARTQDAQGTLDKPLRLDGKPTTLAELATEIAKQATVTVKFPDFLGSRRIQASSRGSSVRRVIDALCDMEGWSWTADGGKTVKIEGPAPGRRAGETMFMALRRVTPPDLVNYLRMPKPDKFAAGGAGENPFQKHEADIRERCGKAFKPQKRALEAGIRMADLKLAEAELAMEALLASPRVRSAFEELLQNNVWQAAVPEAARLRIEQGHILLIECDLPGQGITGFGANVREQLPR